MTRAGGFCEAPCRFNIFCNRYSFDIFAVDMCYQKSYYVKYTINPIEKSNKNHNNKGNKSKYLSN